MALLNKVCITQSSDCKTLTFKDETGIYDALTNTGGYGTPNENTIDFTTAQLIVSGPGLTSAVILDITGNGFPTTNKDLEFSITSTSLALTADTELMDGHYTIQYKLIKSDSSFIVLNKTKFLECNSKCRLRNLLLNVANEGTLDPCNSDLIDTAVRANMFLNAAKAASACGVSATVDKGMRMLNKLLDSENCNC